MENQLTTDTPKRSSPSSSAQSTGYPLKPRKAVRPRHTEPLPDLSEKQILRWADAFFERNGVWPNWYSGPIPELPGETWYAVAGALALGLRGLSHRRSLGRLIEECRSPPTDGRSSYSVTQILRWVDAWIAEHGHRPTYKSGAIPGAGGVKWRDVDIALRLGGGVLRGGSCLARFLAKERTLRRRSPITEKQILFWADAFHERKGRWPRAGACSIPESPGDTWAHMDRALRKGSRGLPGGTTLDELLVAQRAAAIQDVSAGLEA